MKHSLQVLLYLAILGSLGANWDMSGTKSKWNMLGARTRIPTLTPALTATVPTLPDPPAFKEVKSTQPVIRTYPKRIRLFHRWR